MADTADRSVRRVPVAPEPLLAGATPDYADAFELRLARPDAHTAGQWVQAALAEAPSAVTALIRFVHARVLRFELSPQDDSILGWHTVSSTPEALHLRTQGPLLRAEIVLRRGSPSTATVSTFLFYGHRFTPLLWRVVGPLHRRIAPYLMRRAAERLARA